MDDIKEYEKFIIEREKTIIEDNVVNSFEFFGDDEIDKEVKRLLEIFIQRECIKGMFKDAETYDAIDLKEYFNMIRNSDIEKAILIGVLPDKIEYKIIEGTCDMISIEAYYNIEVVKTIKEWISKGAKILNYHNHPYRIAARPSNTDIVNLSVNCGLGIDYDERDGLNEVNTIEFYDENGFGSFKYDDWGVLTKFDFFSFSQGKDRIVNIYKENLKH